VPPDHADAAPLIALYAHPAGCACGCKASNFVALKGDRELLLTLHASQPSGVNDALQQRYAGGFDKAVTAVFGAGKPNPELERQLRISAARFGTFKAYDLGKKLDALAGKGLNEDAFVKKATALLNLYNGFQKTEYSTLVNRARTAKQWQQFADERDLYPNIEWLRTASSSPRPEHAALTGLVLPQNDPFWDSNQPGNEYNCKCNWRTTDKPTTAKPANVKPPAQGLEGNPAATGEMVTERHPYFARNADAPRWVSQKALLWAPDEVGFSEVSTKWGAYKEHLLLGEAKSATGRAITAKNREMTTLLLQNGYKNIALLPEIDKGEPLLRERYYGKGFNKLSPTKCPDAKMGDTLLEYKECNRRNLSRHILDAASKSTVAVVKVLEPMAEGSLQQFVENQWKMSDRENLKELLLHVNGELRKFKRP
jgi:hypothetical protein